MKNWRTTISGIASIISGVSLYINHPEQIEIAAGMVMAGIGLLLSKDHNVTGKSNNIFGGRPDDRK